MVQIAIDGLHKSFGVLNALRDISLVIEPGEFLVVLGPSGCGKTTFLRILAGLEQASLGRVLFDNQSVDSLGPKERDVAMIFQDHALYPHLSVYDNIAFGLKMRGVSFRETDNRLKEIFRLMEIDSYLDRRCYQLSGGQQQRVAIARALVRRPTVFLFDEPLNSLDANLRAKLRMEIKTRQKQLGITTVYVTHDQDEAMALADRMMILHEGKLIQLGSPQQLYERPLSKFVGSFLGVPGMNFMTGNIQHDGKSVSFQGEDWIQIENDTKRYKAGDPVLVGFRPEQTRVLDGSRGPGISIQVNWVERYAGACLVYGTTCDGSKSVTLRITTCERVSAGSALRVCPSEVAVFDSKSEMRL